MAFLILVSLLRVVHMNSLLSLWWKHHIFFSLPCYVLKIAFTFCRVCVRFYDDIMRGRRTMTRFCTEHIPINIIWSFRNWTCFLWVYCIFVATSAIIFRFEFVSSSVQAFSINKKGQKIWRKKHVHEEQIKKHSRLPFFRGERWRVRDTHRTYANDEMEPVE